MLTAERRQVCMRMDSSAPPLFSSAQSCLSSKVGGHRREGEER